MTKPRLNVTIALTALLFASGCSKEQYGFVARLGNDTTSIEKITRQGNTIESDVVEHSPRVIRKHWSASLNDDGTIRTWRMDKLIANPDPGEAREAHYSAVFTRDSVIVTGKNGRQAQAAIIKDVLPVTVPWESYVYGLYELLFEAAARQKRDSVEVRQLQPGYGRFGSGLVRRQPDGSITFVTTGLAGTGQARLDANGRMLSYSGAHTTYKQEVVRVADVGDLDAIADRFAAREKIAPVHSLSPLDSARATIGTAVLSILYSRPSLRGRQILGDVVPYDRVWRTGANAATQLSVSAPITIAGLKVPAGSYTLWTLPGRTADTLIINRQTGQWGTRYDANQDLGRVPLERAQLTAPVEQFTIQLQPLTAKTGELLFEWDHFRLSAAITQ